MRVSLAKLAGWLQRPAIASRWHHAPRVTLAPSQALRLVIRRAVAEKAKLSKSMKVGFRASRRLPCQVAPRLRAMDVECIEPVRSGGEQGCDQHQDSDATSPKVVVSQEPLADDAVEDCECGQAAPHGEGSTEHVTRLALRSVEYGQGPLQPFGVGETMAMPFDGEICERPKVALPDDVPEARHVRGDGIVRPVHDGMS